MPFAVLVGGARSGKSYTAIKLAEAAGDPVAVVATATAGDDEMAARIAAHRRERPSGWTTVEEPLDVEAAVSGVASGSFVVLDCLTLWVSNALEEGWDDVGVLTHASGLARLLSRRAGRGVVVTNEVGSGIVPASASVRRYRDLLGAVYRTVAGEASQVFLMVAGHAVRLTEVTGV
jgi:adenosyl cobinamide kinase/adenosyl cobinamide phosphate guanylyltransferase